MKLFNIIGELLTEAPKRRLDQEMSTPQALALLQRRMDHHNKLPKPVATAVRRMMYYNHEDAINRIVDYRNADPLQLAEWKRTRASVQIAAATKAFLDNPGGFYIYDTGEKSEPVSNWNSAQQHIIDGGFPIVYVGNKAILAQNNLDEDDFEDFCEMDERINNHVDNQRRYKGTQDRLQKRHNETQASAMHQAASSAMAGPAPTPSRTINLSGRKMGLINPYYYSNATNQYNGPLSGVQWQKKGMKNMIDVFALALAQLGYPLININHVVLSSGEDAFYAFSANETVKIYVSSTTSSEMLLGIKNTAGAGSAYRLKRLYSAGSPTKTASNIAFYLPKPTP